jgi:hypothetical protein
LPVTTHQHAQSSAAWFSNAIRSRAVELRQCVRITVAAQISYALVEFHRLPLGPWAVLTAVIVTQFNARCPLPSELLQRRKPDRAKSSFAGRARSRSTAVPRRVAQALPLLKTAASSRHFASQAASAPPAIWKRREKIYGYVA